MLQFCSLSGNDNNFEDDRDVVLDLPNELAGCKLFPLRCFGAVFPKVLYPVFYGLEIRNYVGTQAQGDVTTAFAFPAVVPLQPKFA